MFEKMVRISASWDWVTPMIAFFQDWRYRPSTGFSIPYGHSYSAWEIKRFLKSKGIRVWGVMVIGDNIILRVREAQALYAEYWLQRMGVPYEGGLSLEAAEKYRAARPQTEREGPEPERAAPKKRAGLTGVLDSIDTVADGIKSSLSADPG